MRNRGKIIFFLFFFFLTVLLKGETLNDTAAVITDEILELGPFLEILEDPERKLTIEYILQNEKYLPFVKLEGLTANYGYSRSVFWVRFSLKNSSSESAFYTLVYKYALIGLLDLYTVSADGSEKNKSWTHDEGGFYRPFHMRSRNYRNPNFNLKIKSGINQYYMRIETSSPVNIHLVMYTYRDFVSLITGEMFSHGVYFGSLLVIFLYNLFMYAVLKEKNYLYYIFFVFFWLAFSYSYEGYARQYLWPDAPRQMMYSTMTSLGFATIFIALFSSKFLELKYISNFYYQFFRILIIAIIISTITLYISFSTGAQLLIFFAFFTLLSYMAIGIYYYYKRNRYIRYFISGLFVFFLGWIFTGMQEIGLFPGKSFNILGHTGTILMMAFISLSLTDRYNYMKEQILINQKKINLAQENYSESLQRKVTEKTDEIRNEKIRLETFVKGMESELSLARSIRDKFIFRTKSSNFIPYFFHPASNVGVDYLDYFRAGGRSETGIILGDVAGHGIHSMFNILILKTITLEAGEKKNNPSLMIAHINDFLRKNPVFGFMTMIYCIFNTATGELNFSNAGFLSPVLVTEKEVRPLSNDCGIVLGIMDTTSPEFIEKQFRTFQFQLKKNEKIILYSAGLLKAVGARSLTDISPLTRMFLRYADYSADDFLNAIQFELKGNSKKDDITVVCLEISE